MKKREMAMMITTVLIIAAIVGCASNSGNTASAQTSTTQTGTSSQSVSKSNPDVPDWYLNPPEDPDYLFGVGSAKMQSTDRSRRASEHRARNSLTFLLNTYVKAMQVDYGKEAGTTNDMAVTELFENIDRQLAAAVLNGARVSKRFVASDGTHYALISYPKNSAKEAVKGVVESAASKTATIQAGIALDVMDKEFAKGSKPQPVDTGE